MAALVEDLRKRMLTDATNQVEGQLAALQASVGGLKCLFGEAACDAMCLGALMRALLTASMFPFAMREAETLWEASRRLVEADNFAATIVRESRLPLPINPPAAGNPPYPPGSPHFSQHFVCFEGCSLRRAILTMTTTVAELTPAQKEHLKKRATEMDLE